MDIEKDQMADGGHSTQEVWTGKATVMWPRPGDQSAINTPMPSEIWTSCPRRTLISATCSVTPLLYKIGTIFASVKCAQGFINLIEDSSSFHCKNNSNIQVVQIIPFGLFRGCHR